MDDDDIKSILVQIRDHLPKLATKADLKAEIDALRAELRAEMKAEIGGLRSEMKAEIGDLRLDMNAGNESLRTELKGDIAALDKKLSEFMVETRWRFETVNARLDEQRATVNALIPTRIAAVPPAAE